MVVVKYPLTKKLEDVTSLVSNHAATGNPSIVPTWYPFRDTMKARFHCKITISKVKTAVSCKTKEFLSAVCCCNIGPLRNYYQSHSYTRLIIHCILLYRYIHTYISGPHVPYSRPITSWFPYNMNGVYCILTPVVKHCRAGIQFSVN